MTPSGSEAIVEGFRDPTDDRSEPDCRWHSARVSTDLATNPSSRASTRLESCANSRLRVEGWEPGSSAGAVGVGAAGCRAGLRAPAARASGAGATAPPGTGRAAPAPAGARPARRSPPAGRRPRGARGSGRRCTPLPRRRGRPARGSPRPTWPRSAGVAEHQLGAVLHVDDHPRARARRSISEPRGERAGAPPATRTASSAGPGVSRWRGGTPGPISIVGSDPLGVRPVSTDPSPATATAARPAAAPRPGGARARDRSSRRGSRARSGPLDDREALGDPLDGGAVDVQGGAVAAPARGRRGPRPRPRR